jgi:inosine-uridine nucleoside N-ribohydrolase
MIGCVEMAALAALAALAQPAAPAAPLPPAPWPPPDGPLRVIIDTDANNEIDDQWALALAIGFPERLKIEGIVAAHYGKSGGGAAGIQKSYDEAVATLGHARGFSKTADLPIKRGSPALASLEDQPASEGVDFIIERALTATRDRPLWLVLLGPVTDAVVALRKEPRIADRMIVFWHGRSDWPIKCTNFNATNDPFATRLIFEVPSRFILFDTGKHLWMSLEETDRRIAPLGSLGAYLRKIRDRRDAFRAATKGIFDLGDIVALVERAGAAPSTSAWRCRA